jgi:hypothetical protein
MYYGVAFQTERYAIRHIEPQFGMFAPGFDVVGLQFAMYAA